MLKAIIMIFILTFSLSGTFAEEGFVRVEKIGGRWYFIDGNGKPFISKGVTHTDVAEKHFMPEYGEENWKSVVEKDLIRLGFNGHGYHSDKFHSMNLKFYVLLQILDISTYSSPFRYVDIFDPVEQSKIYDKVVWATDKYKDNPNLIGYMFTDIPSIQPKAPGSWEPQDINFNWVNFMRGLDEAAPGKTVYVEWLQDQYDNDIDAFNAVYQTSADSFDALKALNFKKPVTLVYPDDLEFIKIILNKFYEFTSRTFRDNDENHLLIGENYGEWFGTQAAVIEVAAKYVDVISVQPSWTAPMKKTSFWDVIYNTTGKPMIISDFKLGHKIDNGREYYPPYSTQEEAGQLLVQYFDDFLSTEYMIGWNHCEYIDEILLDGRIKQGLYTVDGSPYTTYQNYVKQANEKMTNFVTENTNGSSAKIKSSRARDEKFNFVAQPNPFNQSTVLQFDVATSSETKIIIYNLLGKPVSEIFQGRLSTGRRRFLWKGIDLMGSPLASGLYIVNYLTPNKLESGKITILR